MTTVDQVELSIPQLGAVIDGYCYECSCGELYRSESFAIDCRKCRTYTAHGYCTEVYNVLTGVKVYESPIIAIEQEREDREAKYQREAQAPFTMSDICPALTRITL